MWKLDELEVLIRFLTRVTIMIWRNYKSAEGGRMRNLYPLRDTEVPKVLSTSNRNVEM